MTTDATAPAAPVTRTCTAGNHLRCLGTVYVPGGGLVPCGCKVENCGHGSDSAKAQRKRGS